MQRYEAWNVLQRDDLRVLDAIAQVLAAVQLLGCLEAVEHFAVGAIANRVDACLITLGEPLADHRGQFIGLVEQQAAVAGIVGVGRQHGGAATAQCAVGKQLHCAHSEKAAAIAWQRAILADGVEILAGVWIIT